MERDRGGEGQRWRGTEVERDRGCGEGQRWRGTEVERDRGRDRERDRGSDGGGEVKKMEKEKRNSKWMVDE